MIRKPSQDPLQVHCHCKEPPQGSKGKGSGGMSVAVKPTAKKEDGAARDRRTIDLDVAAHV